MLSATQQGILVLSSLNLLPHKLDLLDPATDVDGCCPDCCAPCHLLRELMRAGTLDEIVTWAPNHMWSDLDWWVNGRVDREWLDLVWGCQSEPRCEVTRRACFHHPDGLGCPICQGTSQCPNELCGGDGGACPTCGFDVSDVHPNRAKLHPVTEA